MLLFTAATELLLPTTTHLVLLLSGLCLWAWLGADARVRRFLAPALALWMWAWLFSTPAIANLLVRHLEGPPTALTSMGARDERSVVVVLASGEVWSRAGRQEARLDDSGWERMRAAVQLWKVTGGRLLVTGGPGDAVDDTSSFAALMARIASEMGVPRQSILISAGSSRTYEDLLLAAPAIRGESGPVWLVTSALHMPRSLAVAKQLALPVKAFRCDFRQIEMPTWKAWLPNSGGPRLFAAALHEVLGLQYYRLRGWAS